MKGWQGKLPIALSFLFVTAIVALAARALREWRGPALGLGVALIALYLVWLAVEARVAVREVEQGETRDDRGSLQLYAAGRALTVIAGLGLESWFGPRGEWLPVAAGLAVFVAGVALRLRAIWVLGRFYSHYVREQADHAIVDHGPYRHLRHPAYTGMLLAHVGFVLALFHPLAAACLLLWFLPAVVYRIKVEEELLMRIAGYPEYAAGRKRLVPGLW